MSHHGACDRLQVFRRLSDQTSLNKAFFGTQNKTSAHSQHPHTAHPFRLHRTRRDCTRHLSDTVFCTMDTFAPDPCHLPLLLLLQLKLRQLALLVLQIVEEQSTCTQRAAFELAVVLQPFENAFVLSCFFVCVVLFFCLHYKSAPPCTHLLQPFVICDASFVFLFRCKPFPVLAGMHNECIVAFLHCCIYNAFKLCTSHNPP